jgi:hypothetical protein
MFSVYLTFKNGSSPSQNRIVLADSELMEDRPWMNVNAFLWSFSPPPPPGMPCHDHTKGPFHLVEFLCDFRNIECSGIFIGLLQCLAMVPKSPSRRWSRGFIPKLFASSTLPAPFSLSFQATMIIPQVTHLRRFAMRLANLSEAFSVCRNE